MTQFSNKEILSLIDLTLLGSHDSTEDIRLLCHKAHSALGDVAAVCIYPQFVPLARRTLDAQDLKHIPVATVVNFPHGDDHLQTVVEQAEEAIRNGAAEIDVVLPYKAIQKGDTESASALVKAVCQTSHKQGALVKVILETGELKTREHIQIAADIAIEAGADFLKTSTGKSPIGATLEAVDIMIIAINAEHVSRTVGIKVSGGVRTKEDAEQYLNLITSRMGQNWVSAQHVRLGASSLLDNLLDEYID